MNWVKLDLFHLGLSAKKHYIFRATKWNKDFENIIRKPIYSETYDEIGTIIDIFGPIQMPFISIKPKSEPKTEFESYNKFYVKVR
ncbi:MAG: hypothetical protein GF317_09350 [Candidatus Lokiarchaeota archaeon]|nr:hypothetical protein [Candidatus Lokiarchaeota archaeon]MBD3199917.1 hypothetical protein [Candidatus Lokiarchaeota archaeon]